MKSGFRNQIQRVSMIVAFITVVGYALPTLYWTITGLREGAQKQVELQALNTAVHLQQHVAEGLPLDTSYLAKVTGEGSRVAVRFYGNIYEYGTVEVEAITATKRIGVIMVTISTDNKELQVAIQRLLITTAIYGLIIALAAWLISRELAIRFERPIQKLVDAAIRIEAGDTRVASQRYGVVELDNVAEVLDSVSSRIQQLLLVERQLTSEVSHQLRTPLTALQLQIDEILESSDNPEIVRQEAGRASKQIDRITQAMQDLISARRGLGANSKSEIRMAIQPVINDFQDSVKAQGRQLKVDIPDGLVTDAAAGAVRHMVAILLENSLQHGSGQIQVEAIPGAEWLVLKISDDGAGLPLEIGQALSSLQRQLQNPVDLGPHIGLSLAVTLAVGVGGRLEWRPNEASAVRLYLPAAQSTVE
jgi:signal transduction histidine kinase